MKRFYWAVFFHLSLIRGPHRHRLNIDAGIDNGIDIETDFDIETRQKLILLFLLE